MNFGSFFVRKEKWPDFQFLAIIKYGGFQKRKFFPTFCQRNEAQKQKFIEDN